MSVAVVFVMAPCVGCAQLFSFNPFLVPSIDVDGTREPICQACVDVVNPQRIRNGLEPIVPKPGAYAPMDENEWLSADDV